MELLKYCKCGEEYKFYSGFSRIVYYCEYCKSLAIEEKECEHELVPIKMIISNGTIQLRLLCKNCYYLDPKPKKISDYPNVTLTKKLEDLNNYRSNQELKTDEFLSNIKQTLGISFRSNYEAYINSPEWKTLRLKILERDNFICQICGSAAEEVHHLTYKHLGHEFYFELISLCEKCHQTEYHD